MKASEIKGRAVVILQQAEKIGTVGSLILDPNSSAVVGLKIKTGLFSGDRYVRAQDIRSVGPDAVTIPDQARVRDNAGELAELNGMPDQDDVGGTKVVSESGSLVGSIDDVIVDMQTFRIEGYELGGSLWDQLTGHQKVFNVPQSGIRFGKGLLVVPDEVAAQVIDIKQTEAAAERPGETAASGEGVPLPRPGVAAGAASADDGSRARGYSAETDFSDWQTSTAAATSDHSQQPTYTGSAETTYQPTWQATTPAGSQVGGPATTSGTGVQPYSSSSTLYPPAAGEATAPGDTATIQSEYGYDAAGEGEIGAATAHPTYPSAGVEQQGGAAGETADEEIEERPSGQGGQSTSSY